MLIISNVFAMYLSIPNIWILFCCCLSLPYSISNTNYYANHLYYILLAYHITLCSCQESSSVEVEREEIASLLQKGDSCRQVGNEENSIAFYYRSLELAKQTGEQSLEAAASDRLGIVYLYRELYYDALDLFRQNVRRFMH